MVVKEKILRQYRWGKDRNSDWSRQDMLASIPCLNPDVRWEVLDSGEMMAIYRRHRAGAGKWLARFFHLNETVQVALDEPGTQVVRCIDGRRSVKNLIQHAQEMFHLSRREAEAAVLKYLEILAQRRLVGFLPAGDNGKEGNM